ncbi:MAG TPA: AsmA-like C-terminal region-containing protein [Methylotenera sp.]|nr:AsmA-like C-terminal region-containing protein [Methylotenera sp.]HPH05554.1 AsmA-like C-terminal region-containing protein [Methylotenera sp.]
MMNLTAIYTKTAEGLRVRKALFGGLSAPLKRVIDLVDGHESVQAIAKQLSDMPESKVIAAVTQLEKDGYIKYLSEATTEDDWEFGTVFSPMVVEEIEVEDQLDFPADLAPSQLAEIVEANRLEDERKAREIKAQIRLKEKAKAEIEENARIEAQRIAQEAIEKEKTENQARAKAALEAKLKAEAEELARQLAEQKAREEAEKIQQEKDRLEREAQALAEASAAAEAQAKLEAEAKKQAEENEKARLEAERIASEAAEVQRQADLRAAKIIAEEEAKAAEEALRIAQLQAIREAEERANAEAEQIAVELRLKQEAEDKIRIEAERAAREAEEKQRNAEETLHKAELEAQALVERIRAKEKARREQVRKTREEEAAKQKADEEAKAAEDARLAQEQQARQEAEAQERALAEARAIEEAKQKARLEAERILREEENARREAEEAARLEAERIAQEEEATRRKAEEAELQKAQEEAEEISRLAAEKQARLEAETIALAQEEARAEKERVAQEKARAAQEKAEEKARVKAEEKAQKEAEKRAKQEQKAARAAEKAAQKLAKMQTIAPMGAHDSRLGADDGDREILSWEVMQAQIKHQSSRKKLRLPKVLSASNLKIWFKRFIRFLVIYVPILALVLLGFMHFAPLTMLVEPVEKIASDSLGTPVKVGEVRASLWPQPHFVLQQVTLGEKKSTLNVGVAHIEPEISTLFDKTKVMHSITVDGLNIAQEDYAIPLQSVNKLIASDQLDVRAIQFKNVKLNINEFVFGTFDGWVDFDKTRGLSGLEMKSVEQALTLHIRPVNGTYQVMMKAQQYKLPFGEKVVFDEITAHGLYQQNQVNFDQIDGEIYGGDFNANALLNWQNAWQITGDFKLNKVNTQQVLKAFSSAGSVDGKLTLSGNFNAHSTSAATLMDAAEVNASFEVPNSKISGIDIPRNIVTPTDQSLEGYATYFDKLSGNLKVANGRYQYRNLVLKSAKLQVQGQVDIDDKQNISGKLSANLYTPTRNFQTQYDLTGKIDNVKRK